MSAYGSTSTVAVVPYIASQRFRDALRQDLPGCLHLAVDQPVTSRTTADLINSATDRGLISATQAARYSDLLSGMQRTEVAAAAAETLADLGFHVRLASGATSSLWAERDHQVMAVEVHDGGGFAYDLAGIDDGTCHEILNDFHQGMARRGVTYTPGTQTHNDPRGGQLVRRVLNSTSTTRRAAQQAGRRAKAT
jgi:guanyl-specific ribonuclease Sa